MTLPIAENIPKLDFNFEGLKRHSYFGMFLSEDSLSKEKSKLRAWLLHTLIKSARHYSKARELVSLQNNTDQVRDGGVIFYVFDLSEQIEDCISTTYRICMAVKKMNSENLESNNFCLNNDATIQKLGKIRNQFEHMHDQIVSGETGRGPIFITLSDSGRMIKFRKVKLETTSLYSLIKGLYIIIAGLYPQFDVNSKPEAGGLTKLSVSVSVSLVNKSK